MKRLVVTGVTGQVGFELLRACQPLGEVIGVDRASVDLSRPDEVQQLLDHLRPDVIINPAAYTAVDKAESEEMIAHAVNATAVGVMADHAYRSGALMVHLSTDYVFDGCKTTPYRPSDEAAPIGAYGRSKLAGERALADSGCDYICLRTSWVYASRGRNFLRTMLKLGQERDELRIVSDQVGAPTSARLLADIVATVVHASGRERALGEFRSEVLHATASGETSWHGFATAILTTARQADPARIRTSRVIAIPTADYPTPARRPLNSRLDCSGIAARYGINLPHWEVGLKLCMEELA